jgi:hypothetical protein
MRMPPMSMKGRVSSPKRPILVNQKIKPRITAMITATAPTKMRFPEARKMNRSSPPRMARIIMPSLAID